MAVEQKPTVGRIVRFVVGMGERQGETRAAIVDQVYEGDIASTGLIDLTYFALGAFGASMVKYDEAKANGTWHWPELGPEARAAGTASTVRDYERGQTVGQPPPEQEESAVGNDEDVVKVQIVPPSSEPKPGHERPEEEPGGQHARDAFTGSAIKDEARAERTAESPAPPEKQPGGSGGPGGAAATGATGATGAAAPRGATGVTGATGPTGTANRRRG